jgi:hypothetical protein
MKTYREKTVKVLDQTICDICGKTCTDDFYNNHENATLEALWGYSSRHDGTSYEIHLCENCFYDTIHWMKNKRIEYMGPFNLNDKCPFDGHKYNILG